MINPYKLKKIFAPVVIAILSVVPFWIVTQAYGIVYGSCAFVLSMMISYFVNHLILKSPFSSMLEGDGLLAMDISSKGVISPFILSLRSPFMVGKYNGRLVEDYYNRRGISQIFAGKELKLDQDKLDLIAKEVEKAEEVLEKSEKKLSVYLTTKNIDETKKKALELDVSIAKKLLILAKADMEIFGNNSPLQTKNNRVILNLNLEEFSDARCAFIQYPCLMYNSQLGSIITKDFLSEKEKSFFTENKLLYLAKKVEGLSDDTKHFARHVINLTSKEGGMSTGKAIGIFIVAFLVIGAIGYIVATQMGWI